jgi:hypothetical protein
VGIVGNTGATKVGASVQALGRLKLHVFMHHVSSTLRMGAYKSFLVRTLARANPPNARHSARFTLYVQDTAALFSAEHYIATRKIYRIGPAVCESSHVQVVMAKYYWCQQMLVLNDSSS